MSTIARLKKCFHAQESASIDQPGYRMMRISPMDRDKTGLPDAHTFLPGAALAGSAKKSAIRLCKRRSRVQLGLPGNWSLRHCANAISNNAQFSISISRPYSDTRNLKRIEHPTIPALLYEYSTSIYEYSTSSHRTIIAIIQSDMTD